MSRVQLKKIHALKFFKDEVTIGRRTRSLPQLVCHGEACKLYQPEVVRCVNLGGEGSDIDWNCEADLPEKLRFGKVEVGCEGWSKPGDPFIFEGSCSLDYRLVRVPDTLYAIDSTTSYFKVPSYDVSTLIFMILWVGFLTFIVYSWLSSYCRRPGARRAFNNRSPPGGGGGGGGSDNWFSSNNNFWSDNSKGIPSQNTGWGSFWTGALLGGLANHFWRNRSQPAPGIQQGQRSSWGQQMDTQAPFSSQASTSRNQNNRSSDLGELRTSTGIGGTNVR